VSVKDPRTAAILRLTLTISGVKYHEAISWMRLDLPAIWPGRTSKGEIYLFKQDFERTDSVENDILVLSINPNETIGTGDTKILRKLSYRGFGSFIEVAFSWTTT